MARNQTAHRKTGQARECSWMKFLNSAFYEITTGYHHKMKIIKQSSYKKVPWKNGQGFTFEIAADPEIHFDWRISSATVDKDSDFSLYPEYSRTLVILDGALKLIQGDLVQLVHKLEPFCFSGETPTRCELVNGPVHDLNIFVHKNKLSSTVEVIEIKSNETYMWNTTADKNFAFLISGFCDDPHISAGDTLLAEPGSEAHLHFPSGGILILINLTLR